MSADGLKYTQDKGKDSVEDLEGIQEAKPKPGNITEFTAQCWELKHLSEVQLHLRLWSKCVLPSAPVLSLGLNL